MSTVRNIIDIARDNNLRRVYAIFPSRQWEHYDPEHCPAPIRDWIAARYPEVAIEKVEGFTKYQDEPGQTIPVQVRDTDILYRIGFTRDQAKHFVRTWSTFRPLGDNSVDDFFFLTIDITPCGLEHWHSGAGGGALGLDALTN